MESRSQNPEFRINHETFTNAYMLKIDLMHINPCPADLDISSLQNSVDPDQLASV